MSQQGINGLNIPSIPKRAITFQQNPVAQTSTSMQGATTTLQGIDADKVKQSVDNSYYANRMKASEDADATKVLGLTIPIWFGIAKFMDYFNPKCAGEYKESLPGKLTSWGDKFATQNPIGKKINNFCRWVNVKTYNMAKKSQFIYTLRNHSTSPEWSFAKMPGAGVLGFLSGDAQTVTEEFLKPIADKPKNFLGFTFGRYNAYQKLENYGMSQADINAFVDSLKGQTHEQKAIALQAKELELLGVDPALIERVKTKGGFDNLTKMAKSKKIKLLGFKNEKDFNLTNGKFLENSEKVGKMFEKMAKEHPTWKISIWRSQGGLLAKIKNFFFGRTVSFQEYHNKYLATTGKGSKTFLGKTLGKSIAWLTEGLTNRWAGGKLAVFMQAYIFGDMLLNTIKAPKNEKIKTVAERLVNDFSLFIGMTIGIMAMHKVGGFKFAGLDKKGVKAYEKALEMFKTQVKNGAFQDKKSYKAAKKALKDMLGAKNIKNPIVKLLHKAALVINMGNQRVPSYHSNKALNMNWFRFFKNSNILGVPLRIWIPLGLISPFIAKTNTKLAHLIFGRPTHSVLDEDEEQKEDETAKAAQEMVQQSYKDPSEYQSDTNLIKMAANKQNSQTQNQTFKGNETPNEAKNLTPKNPNEYQSDTNLIKMTMNGEKPPVRTYIPSPECKVEASPEDKKEMEPTRTYIPSPQGMVQKDPDMTAAEKALAQADMAEKFVNETLASINRA